MTKKQIKAEIAALRSITPKLPRFNLFNENIHAKVAAQIEVLQNDLNEDDIYRRSVDGDGGSDDSPELWPAHIRESALHAQQWRDGESGDDDSPSESWQSVAKFKRFENAVRNRK